MCTYIYIYICFFFLFGGGGKLNFNSSFDVLICSLFITFSYFFYKILLS